MNPVEVTSKFEQGSNLAKELQKIEILKEKEET
jgi:hypothetical protein